MEVGGVDDGRADPVFVDDCSICDKACGHVGYEGEHGFDVLSDR